ncbi:rhamnogalacturonan acetylesterase [Bacillus sonorensis]|nr:rhamnogalacturonan acetylesterase [Bacillus sonorensis]UBF35044.1 rhamnogalacturonan acetylesterase [Bacillus sp. PM8313]MCY7855595.1 rhamnogalacturonan acetylesterase [Bacillus sonorensis]MCY8025226.1 rhamnogalacturonan acetylesterase [Bacillus sonorensis]MCY8032470.1 rhamnogalacturonan acetylesterase [Bacillus sonorensis]
MNEKPKASMYLAGDSTVADCPPHEAPMAGWGQLLPAFFTKEVNIVNLAKGGASSNSFIDEGVLDAIAGRLLPGDYLFIQFGHNDQKSYGTDPFTSYQEQLSRYIHTARNNQAYPVLVTPVQRRHFDENGGIVNTLGDFPKAMMELAEYLQVAMIDLWSKTKALYESLGIEGSKRLFVHFQPGEHPHYPDGIIDNTHFSEEGARQTAGLVAEAIRELGLDLRAYLQPEGRESHVQP